MLLSPQTREGTRHCDDSGSRENQLGASIFFFFLSVPTLHRCSTRATLPKSRRFSSSSPATRHLSCNHCAPSSVPPLGFFRPPPLFRPMERNSPPRPSKRYLGDLDQHRCGQARGMAMPGVAPTEPCCTFKKKKRNTAASHLCSGSRR